ncbi:MAG: sel1 repeat family protein [Hyphomicrobiales bacterium]|nr:sel1 repeat family protein [Hyphomicrobiales bacterium]
MGNRNGQFNCASLLNEGKGIAKDEKKAVEWYAQAAKAGHIEATNLYAEALIQGKHIERDLVKAVQYFQHTAAIGDAKGLYSLAIAFENGIGIEKDQEKAHAYFNLAAALGYPLAGEARARVETTMSKDQVINAQKFAKMWRPKQSSEQLETTEVEK